MEDKLKKILFLLGIFLIQFMLIPHSLAADPASPTNQCGDGICDSAEQGDTSLCPQDCVEGSPRGNTTDSPPAPSSTSSADTSSSSSTYVEGTLKSVVRDKALIFSFETDNPLLSALTITDANGNEVKKLEIFSNSAVKDINIYNNQSSGEKASLYALHVFMIAGLQPNTEYLIKVLVEKGPGAYPMTTFQAKTSSASDSKGSFVVKETVNATFDDFKNFILTMSSTNNTIVAVDNVSELCKKYNLDQELCDSASGSVTQKDTTPKDEDLSKVTTLADKFFTDKIVFYGDIGLLALLLLLELVYILKSRGSWGVVFDSKDKKPLQGAIVRVFLEENNKMLETKVTDAEGRYSFLVKPGNFYLDVTKSEYRFPSKFITRRDDEFYSDMYRGEVLHIFKGNAVLNPNIPVDKTGETLESMEASHKALSSFGKKFNYFMVSKVRLILLVLATVLNVGFVIIAYVPPLMVIAILVGLMWLLEGYALFKKGYH